MSLFEFQAGRPNCNPLLPQLSPLQASKICKLIPFLTKGDSGFLLIVKDEQQETIYHEDQAPVYNMDANADILLSLSYCFSSLFVFLLFLAIIVQVVREVSSYSILKSKYFKKTLLQNENLEIMHYSLPTFCYKFILRGAYLIFVNFGTPVHYIYLGQ